MRRHIPLLALMALAASCHQTAPTAEPHFPQPHYPLVALSQEMLSIEGLDTLWGDQLLYSYDSLGRFLSVARLNSQGRTLRLTTHSYRGPVDTLRHFDPSGRLLQTDVYTFADESFTHLPAYTSEPYARPLTIESYSPDGVLLQKRNLAYDARGRLTQVDGFDVADHSTFLTFHTYQPYRCESRQVLNPGTAQETTTTLTLTYLDSACLYLLRSSTPLPSGTLDVTHHYDTLGRLMQKVTTLDGRTIETVQYDYFPDHEREIIIDDRPLRGHIRRYLPSALPTP